MKFLKSISLKHFLKKTCSTTRCLYFYLNKTKNVNILYHLQPRIIFPGLKHFHTKTSYRDYTYINIFFFSNCYCVTEHLS